MHFKLEVSIVYSSVKPFMPRTKPEAPKPDGTVLPGPPARKSRVLSPDPNRRYGIPPENVPSPSAGAATLTA